jgi:hypothetical protein
MNATDIIKDGCDRIKLGLREGRFTKEEMEGLLKYFEECVAATRRVLAKDPSAIGLARHIADLEKMAKDREDAGLGADNGPMWREINRLKAELLAKESKVT